MKGKKWDKPMIDLTKSSKDYADERVKDYKRRLVKRLEIERKEFEDKEWFSNADGVILAISIVKRLR